MKDYISEWPYNLIEDILNYPLEEPVTEWQIDGLNYILDKIKPKERDLILAKYKDGKPLRAIGKDHGFGGERARQIIARGIRKLRYPSLKIYILKDYLHVIADYETKIAELDKAIDYKMAELEHLSEELHSVSDEIKAKRTETIDKLMNMSLKDWGLECDLSVRSFNCLRRSGLETVGDVVKRYYETGLLGIRNLGAVSINEIRQKLYAIGAIQDEFSTKE